MDRDSWMMIFQLYPPGSDVNEDIPQAAKRNLHDVMLSIDHNKGIFPDLLNPGLTEVTCTILKYPSKLFGKIKNNNLPGKSSGRIKCNIN